MEDWARNLLQAENYNFIKVEEKMVAWDPNTTEDVLWPWTVLLYIP